jgi:hypothetical protein
MDPRFLAADNAELEFRENAPRRELRDLAPKAVGIVRDALDGSAGPNERKAAVEVVESLKLTKPTPDRATDPAAAERAILERERDEMLADALAPRPLSWRNSDGDGDDEDDGDVEDEDL